MKSHAALLALCLAVGPLAALSGQANLSVPIDDPVYHVIDVGVLRGVLDQQSAVKPYPRARVIELIDRMWDSRDRFSAAEQAVLADTRARFADPREGPAHGNVSFDPSGGAGALQAGVDARARFRLDAGDPLDWHLDSVYRPYLRGDLLPWLSYLGILGFTLDRVRAEETFAPYAFSKEWDAFHISFGMPRYSQGDLAYPTISYDLETELAARFADPELDLGLTRQRREWGIGDGSLTLGGTARPFVGAEAHFALAPWLIGHQLIGSLSDWSREPSGMDAGSGTLSFQKMFALQRLELLPAPWLYVSVSSTILGAKRPELTYLSPLLFGVLAQNLVADLDNVGVGIDLATILPPFGKAYVSFYADEMELTNLARLFKSPRNMIALQGGLQFAVPGLPFTSFTAQYTKIEPFTYAHYPTDYPDYRIPVDTSYTHDGENLAYHLWPNSDEILVKLVSQPVANLRASLEYRLIRHGDNPSASPGDPYILGRPDGYYDYGIPDSSYPDKSFLHDGLYDHNHIATLAGDYAIPGTPITVGLSYTFSYTYWVPNASGEPDRPDVMRNIFGIEVRVFR